MTPEAAFEWLLTEGRASLVLLDLRTPGMEFASELVVRSALEGLKIVEVPTTLSKDGRSRPPHLRTWRDGWRHLKFLLTYSPRWLFLYPGVAFLALGGLAVLLLFPGPVQVGQVGFENKTFIVGCLCLIVGVQSITFSLLGRRYASRQGYLPRHRRYGDLLERLTLERLALAALAFFVLGCVAQQEGEKIFGRAPAARGLDRRRQVVHRQSHAVLAERVGRADLDEHHIARNGFVSYQRAQP